jgi:Gcd10p family
MQAPASYSIKGVVADDEATSTVTKDNRNLVGSSENQQLSSDQIKSLRKQGATGEVRHTRITSYSHHVYLRYSTTHQVCCHVLSSISGYIIGGPKHVRALRLIIMFVELVFIVK